MIGLQISEPAGRSSFSNLLALLSDLKLSDLASATVLFITLLLVESEKNSFPDKKDHLVLYTVFTFWLDSFLFI